MTPYRGVGHPPLVLRHLSDKSYASFFLLCLERVNDAQNTYRIRNGGGDCVIRGGIGEKHPGRGGGGPLKGDGARLVAG